MPTSDPTLPLHEELMLMALRDEEGTLESEASMYQLALAGALLTELFLSNHVRPREQAQDPGWLRLRPDTVVTLEVLTAAATGDPLLDAVLQTIASAKPKPISDWIQQLAGLSDLRHRVARRLCDRGILREQEDRILLLFNRTVYPELDPAPERALRARLDEAIFTDTPDVSPRTALLVALAHATGMLEVYFASDRLKDRADRITALTENNAFGEGTHRAVQEVVAAQTAAIAAATTAAVISH